MRQNLSKLFVSAATAAARKANKTPSTIPPPEAAEAAELTTRKKLVQAPYVSSSSSLSLSGGAKKSKKPCPSVSQQVLRRFKKAVAKKAQSEPHADEHYRPREVASELCSIIRADSDDEAPPLSNHNDGLMPGNIFRYKLGIKYISNLHGTAKEGHIKG